jgi:hypothetical protein
LVADSTSEMSIRARIRASCSVAPMSGITCLQGYSVRFRAP